MENKHYFLHLIFVAKTIKSETFQTCMKDLRDGFVVASFCPSEFVLVPDNG